MTNYFDIVVADLTIDDLGVLTALFDNEAVSNYKSLKYQQIRELSELTKATFYKAIYRLSANKFIVTIPGREYRAYITEFGIIALQKSINEEVI